MILKIIRDLEGVRHYENEWHQLFEDGNAFSIFQHYDWIYKCYENMDENRILLILVFDASNNLAGVFPFAISSLNIKKLVYTTLVHASGPAADYSSFIVSHRVNRKVTVERVIEKLLELQQELWDIYHIDNLNDSDDIANLFRVYLSQAIHGGNIPSMITPSIDYNSPFGESKKLSNIKRRFRKLPRSGEASLELEIDITPGKELITEFRHYHRKLFPAASFTSKKGIALYDYLLEKESFARYISVSFLKDGDNFVAGHFGYKHDKKLYYYVPIYNKEYAKFGPGQYLLMNMIEYYKTAGLQEFDFLRGGERYKEDWFNTAHTNYLVFGVSKQASVFRKSLANIWLALRSNPMFNSNPYI